jgi:hypothetical protein
MLEKIVRLHKMSLVAAKEGPDCAYLWRAGGGGSEAVGEILQGERSQQEGGD